MHNLTESARKASSALLLGAMVFSLLAPLNNAFAATGSFSATQTVVGLSAGGDDTQAADTETFTANIPDSGGEYAFGTVTIGGTWWYPGEIATFTLNGVDVITYTVVAEDPDDSPNDPISASLVAYALKNAIINHNPVLPYSATIILDEQGTGPQNVVKIISHTSGTAGNAISLSVSSSVGDGHDGAIEASGASFSGGAPATSAQTQINAVTINGTIEVGDIFIVNVGGTEFARFTATDTNAITVASGLNAAIRAKVQYGSQAFTSASSTNVITLTAKVAGTGFTQTSSAINSPGVHQVVTFTPTNPTAGETYRATIDGTNYDYIVVGTKTAKDVVEGLVTGMNGNAAVSCTENDIIITCTADTVGANSFLFDTDVLIADAPTPAVFGASLVTPNTQAGILPQTVETVTTQTPTVASFSNKAYIQINSSGTWAPGVTPTITINGIDYNAEAQRALAGATDIYVQPDVMNTYLAYTINAIGAAPVVASTYTGGGQKLLILTAKTAGTAGNEITVSFDNSSANPYTMDVANGHLERGADAVVGKPQKNTVTIGPDVEIGDVFTITSGSEVISYTALNTSPDSVAIGLHNAISANSSVVFLSTRSGNILTLTGKTNGVVFTQTSEATNRPASAQVVDFTPTDPVDGDIFRATINGTNYTYTAVGDDTVQDVVTELAEQMNENSAVTCIDAGTKITCTASESGTPFTYNAVVNGVIFPTILISNPDNTSAPSKTVTASIVGEGGTLYMRNMADGNEVCDASNDEEFIPYESQTFTSEEDNGTRVCFMLIVDDDNYQSFSLSDVISGITTPQVSILISNPDNTSAPSKTVTASIVGEGGTLYMRNMVDEDDVCDGNNYEDFIPYEPQTFTSEEDNGIRVCFMVVIEEQYQGFSLSDVISGITRAPSGGSGGGGGGSRTPVKLNSAPANDGSGETAGSTSTNTPSSSTLKGSTFRYLSDDASIVTQLQSQYPNAGLTEEKYKNTCETRQGKTFYRICELGINLDTFSLFKNSVLCEGFIVSQKNTLGYHFDSKAPRKEVAGVAVKMKRINGANVSLVAPETYKNLYTDIGVGEASWIQPVVETALKYGIITQGTTFEPDRDVSRAEAFAMIMQSVCMSPATVSGNTWQQNIFARASQEGLTTRTWNTFGPESFVLRQELFVVASRASDWAERTGGCDPKPDYCFLKSE